MCRLKGLCNRADTANNIWNYHSSDGENSFFSLPDVVDVTLAEMVTCSYDAGFILGQHHQLL